MGEEGFGGEGVIPRYFTDASRYYSCPKCKNILVKSSVNGILKCCKIKCNIKVRVINKPEHITKAKQIYEIIGEK